MNTRIFIANLDYSVDEVKLFELFTRCGHVQAAKIVKIHGTNKSRGIGFVDFTTEEEAKTAVKTMNDMPFLGRRIRVDIAIDNRSASKI